MKTKFFFVVVSIIASMFSVQLYAQLKVTNSGSVKAENKLYVSPTAFNESDTAVCITSTAAFTESVYGMPSKRDEPINQDIKYANRWKVLTNYFGTYGYPYWVEDNYQAVKDTIIGNYTYQLLSNNKGAIRYSDDGMKFYYLSKSGEYLLCDFSLQVGDTCYAYIGTATYENEENSLQGAGFNLVQPWVVTSREIIDKRVHIKMSWWVEELNYTFETEMIQGIGSHQFIFPMQTGFMFTGGAPSYTLCAFNGEENIYSFDLTEQGINNNCPNWEMISKEDIEMTYINTPSATKIFCDDQIFILRDGKTFTITGQRVE